MTNRHALVIGTFMAGVVGIILALTTMVPVSGSPDSLSAGDLRDVCQGRLDTNPPPAARLKTWLRDCVSAMSTSPLQSIQPTTTSLPISTPPTSTAPAMSTPPATTTPPPVAGFPNQATTGVPAGWVPTTIRTGGWTITAAGTYTDVRVTGGIHVAVDNVSLQRVEVIDGTVNTETASGCRHGTTLDQVTIRSSGNAPFDATNGAVTPGGYTATRVKVKNLTEGFRAGGGSVGCGPVTIRDSFALVRGDDCHCDGLQVYDGAGLSVDGLTVDWAVTVAGTTAFFAPSGEAANGPVNVKRLLLKGGGYALTDAIPGSVDNYFYVAGSAAYGAMAVDCSVVTYTNGHMGAIDSSYQPISSMPLPCGGGKGQ
jgi:hypothetical protein